MKATIDLCYPKETKRVSVSVKGKITPSILDRIDKAVRKAFADDWESWSLVDIDEDSP